MRAAKIIFGWFFAKAESLRLLSRTSHIFISLKNTMMRFARVLRVVKISTVTLHRSVFPVAPPQRLLLSLNYQFFTARFAIPEAMSSVKNIFKRKLGLTISRI
jgi:hypothetical protein